MLATFFYIYIHTQSYSLIRSVVSSRVTTVTSPPSNHCLITMQLLLNHHLSFNHRFVINKTPLVNPTRMTSLTNSPVTPPPPPPSPPDTRSPAASADISLALLSPPRQHILRPPPGATSPRSPPAPPQRDRAHGPVCCPLRSSLLRASATQLHGRDNKTYLRQRPCQLKEELQAHRQRPETVQPPPDPFPSWCALKLLSSCANHRCSARTTVAGIPSAPCHSLAPH